MQHEATEPTMSQPTEARKLYAERDPRQLGQSYLDHMLAMTAENLHSKSDIAAELAARDNEIERLRDAMKWAIGLLQWAKPDLFRLEAKAPNMHTPKVRGVHSCDIPGCAVCDPCDGL